MSASSISSNPITCKSVDFPHLSSANQTDLAQARCLQDRPLDQPAQEKTQTVAKRALSPPTISSSSHTINRFSDDETKVKDDESKAKLKKTSIKEDTSLAKKTEDTQGALCKVKKPIQRSENNALLKLSVNLVGTYKSINDRYFSNKRTQELPTLNPRTLSSTLEGQVFKVSKGSVTLGKRLGEGAYGFVHEGVYKPDGFLETIKVAFKINRVVESRSQTKLYRQSILNEAGFYRSVRKIDPKGSVPIAELIDHGDVATNCHALVQRLYNSNLYQGLKRTNYRGFSFILTARIASQLFESLSLLRHPSVNAIHADLKPENIVLYDGKTYKIRIIDFGTACTPSTNPSPGAYVCSRFYRPPEIIFKLPYDHSFDTWSAGCVLFELHAGKPLFPATDQRELLSMIYDFLGSPSAAFVRAIPNWQSFFAPNPDKPDCFVLNSDFYSSTPSRKETRVGFFDRMLSAETPKAKDYPNPAYVQLFQTDETYQLFRDLIKSMIAWDSKDRMLPDQLLAHPFIAKINRLNSDEMAKKTAALSSDICSKESQANPKAAIALQPLQEDQAASHYSVHASDSKKDE
jgi:serine/threonine protein kinase